MATIYSPSFFQPQNSAGAPLAGAKLYFYLTGTTTTFTVYQDAAAGTPHANPVVADASGIFAPIYIVASTAFKTVLKTSADVTVQTVDPVNFATLPGLLLSTGAVINWNSGDVTITHSANTLAFAGASSGYTFDAAVSITSTATGSLLTLTSTDASATEGPQILLYRDSASPAANDLIGRILFNGENSVGTNRNYIVLEAMIVDPTDASEDGRFRILNEVAGAEVAELTTQGGVLLGAATGGAKGTGSLNATAIYDDNVQITPEGNAKVWVVGTPNSTTIIASHNVTSLGDTATGQQTVTIATDFASANYAVVVTIGDTSTTLVGSATVMTKAAGSYIMNSVVEAGSGQDPASDWNSVAWGAQ